MAIDCHHNQVKSPGRCSTVCMAVMADAILATAPMIFAIMTASAVAIQLQVTTGWLKRYDGGGGAGCLRHVAQIAAQGDEDWRRSRPPLPTLLRPISAAKCQMLHPYRGRSMVV